MTLPTRTALARLNPAETPLDLLKEIGHTPTTPMKAIRKHCTECCGGNTNEVNKCEVVICPLWPFRKNKHPYAGRVKESE